MYELALTPLAHTASSIEGRDLSVYYALLQRSLLLYSNYRIKEKEVLESLRVPPQDMCKSDRREAMYTTDENEGYIANTFAPHERSMAKRFAKTKTLRRDVFQFPMCSKIGWSFVIQSRRGNITDESSVAFARARADTVPTTPKLRGSFTCG